MVTYLNDGLVALDFENLTTALRSVWESEVDDFGILGEL
jgi:hypothetical protein